MKPDRDIWVLAEHRDGELRPVTFEMIQEVRPLADVLDVHVVALVLGSGARTGFSEILARYGADVVAYAGTVADQEDPGLLAGALAEACLHHCPSNVVLPATRTGRDLAPRLAARLGVGLVTNCLQLHLRPDGTVEGAREIYGGRRHATAASFGKRPHVFTFKPGAAGVGKPDRSRTARVIELRVEIAGEPRTRVVKVLPADPRSLDIAEAESIVSVGRGAGSAEAVTVLQELADALGASLGGSRVAADLGWIPRDRLIGLSGKKVSPRLYLAAGISGTNYHGIGMKGAENVIAINSDEGAEIFRRARLGVVGDLRAVVPILLAKIRSHLGKPQA